MTAKVAVQAVKGFNRNLDGQMVTGHPKHPDPRGRYLLLSATSALSLVDAGLAKEMTRAAYDKAMREAEGVQDDEPVQAADVRNIRTEAAGGGTNTGGGGKTLVKARVTMSNEALDALAAERGVDVSGAKSRGEKAKLINGRTPTGDGKSDVTTAGAVGNLSDGSTNHPGASSPHKGTDDRGSVVDRTRVPGEAEAGGGGETGVDAEDDAAPRGGGSSGGGA